MILAICHDVGHRPEAERRADPTGPRHEAVAKPRWLRVVLNEPHAGHGQQHTRAKRSRYEGSHATSRVENGGFV